MDKKLLVHRIHYSCGENKYHLRFICSKSSDLISVINDLINSGFLINSVDTTYE